jgi:hypothetical protein
LFSGKRTDKIREVAMCAGGNVMPATGLLPGCAGFRFASLALAGIDNTRAVERFGPGIRAEEVCLFHEEVASGDAYTEMLGERVTTGMRNRTATPIVRFADGEYAFYRGSLRCNGLYDQAESVEAIQKAIPAHAEDLRYVAGTGILAPLVFPGNIGPVRRKFPAFWKRSGDDGAARFLEFLRGHGVLLGGTNYVPFYVVYAYLTSRAFAAAVDGRKVCILNSDIDMTSCTAWFETLSSRPSLVPVPIPASYVATRWDSMRDEVLRAVPPDADLCLVGAGVGALRVCADIGRRFSIPALDAGHALNMMNDMEKKSDGARLFTDHR